MSIMNGRLAFVFNLFFIFCVAEKQNSKLQEQITEILLRLERIENKLNNEVTDTHAKKCKDCPDNWIGFKDSCYLFLENKYSFHNAKFHCKHLGGHLVHIDNIAENEFLGKHLKPLKTDRFWIGLEKDGVFKWVDDKTRPLFSVWSQGQPDNTGGKEKCVEFIQNHWNDNSCDRAFGSICEKKAMK